MSTRNQAIAVLGNFGTTNIGNEATLQAFLSMLPVERDAVVCICTNPQAAQKMHGVIGVPLMANVTRRWLRVLDRLFLRLPSTIAQAVFAVKTLHGVRLLVIPGTGFLDDYGLSPSREPLSILAWCCAARFRSTNIAMVSVGAGPITGWLNRILMRRIAGLAQHRSYRDLYSRAFVHGLGLDVSRDPVYPDLVFSMKPPQTSHDEVAAGPRGSLALGIMNYHGWNVSQECGLEIREQYIAKMCDLAIWAIAGGMAVHLVTGDTAHDASAVSDVIVAVKRRLPPDRHTWLVTHGIATLSDLHKIIAGVDVVIAARFHNIVCAMMQRKPIIALAYANKTSELMTAFGQARYCHDIIIADVSVLKAQVHELMRRSSAVKGEISSHLASHEAQLASQSARLLRDHFSAQEETSPLLAASR